MGAALDLPITCPVSPARVTLAVFLRRYSAGHDDIAQQINVMIQKRQPLQLA